MNQEIELIVQNGHPTLRTKAREVPLEDIDSADVKKVIQDMKTALASQSDGVAIAAPQIGVALRIFVISGIVLHKADGRYPAGEDRVYINPVITKLSKETREVEEGCLSVRWLYGKVRRSSKATISAYDEYGKKFERGASGLLAQVFQHETDHLDGILFVDRAYDLEDMPPEKNGNGSNEDGGEHNIETKL